MVEKKQVAQAKASGEAKASSQAKASSKSTYTKIEVVGPADETNGAAVLRFNRDGRKKPIDLVMGQQLTVGDGEDADITKEEADRLMSYDRWNFKEVE